MTRPTVLVVDDEPALVYALGEFLDDRGWGHRGATDGADALTKVDGVDAVLTDLSMPVMDGFALLAALRARDPSLPVIVMTAHGDERVAVRAMKAGAFDYLTKPFDLDEVGLVLERALETHRLRAENRHLSAESALGRRVIASSPAMRGLLDAVARVAGRDVTVLVRGETGTGKELVASLLHAQGRRAAGPLVRFNCAAIAGDVADAELFGHTRGAFTGAVAARKGYVAQADGGTLVLDEVGDLPLELQPKLLRTLQEGEVQPVGASRVERVDVRVVASTHRDLRQMVRDGRFREDLLFRLAVVELEVPPLRARREDVGPLAEEFARFEPWLKAGLQEAVRAHAEEYAAAAEGAGARTRLPPELLPEVVDCTPDTGVLKQRTCPPER